MEEKMGRTIVEAFAMQGLDTRKPYMLDFYFYLPDENSAEGLANELRTLGYRVETRPGADGDTILCLGTKVLVPEEAVMNELGDTFNALAARYGGEFDGWETAIG